MKIFKFTFSRKLFWGWALGLFFVAAAVQTTLASDDAVQITLPKPTGPYHIGTTKFHLVDSQRLETLTEKPDDYRQIQVQLWYPAHKCNGKSVADYMDALTIDSIIENLFFSEYLEIDLINENFPTAFTGILETVRPHARVKARPIVGDKPFPLLIFSPGYERVFSQYQMLIEDVVSHGYVVAAVNHPFISGLTVLQNGDSVKAIDDIEQAYQIAVELLGPIDYFEFLEFLFSDDSKLISDSDWEVILNKLYEWESNNINILTEDFYLLLDNLKTGDLKPIIDTDNIGFFGHSLGGAASVESCLKLEECKGAIDIDGTLFGVKHQTPPIEKPLLFVLSEDAPDDETIATAWENINNDGYRLDFKWATHDAWLDEGLILDQMRDTDKLAAYHEDIETLLSELELGCFHAPRVVSVTSKYIVAFFDHYLKGDSRKKITSIRHPLVKIKLSEDK